MLLMFFNPEFLSDYKSGVKRRTRVEEEEEMRRRKRRSELRKRRK